MTNLLPDTNKCLGSRYRILPSGFLLPAAVLPDPCCRSVYFPVSYTHLIANLLKVFISKSWGQMRFIFHRSLNRIPMGTIQGTIVKSIAASVRMKTLSRFEMCIRDSYCALFCNGCGLNSCLCSCCAASSYHGCCHNYCC